MPLLPRALRDAMRLSPRAVSSDFGGGEGLAAFGRGISEGVGAVANLADTIYDRARKAKVMRLSSAAGLEIQKLAQDLQADPNYETHEPRFAEGRDKITARYRDELGGGRYAENFDQELNDLGGRLELGVRANARLKAAQTAAADIDLRLANLIAGMDAAQSEEQIAALSQAYQATVATALTDGIYDPDTAVDRELARRRAVDETTALSRGQLIADQIFDPNRKLADMTTEVRKHLSGKAEEVAVGLVKDRWNEHQIEASQAKAAAAEARTQANDELTDLWLSGSLSMDEIRARAPVLGEAAVGKWVTRATKAPSDGPEQRAYQAELGAMTDGQFAAVSIDPVLAGTQLKQLQTRQRAAKAGEDTGSAFRSRVAGRFNQVREGFDDSWIPLRTNEPEGFKDGVAQDELGSDFWYRALAKWQEWNTNYGKPDAQQEEQLLDEVVNDWIREHKSGAKALSPFGPLERPARDTLVDVPAEERAVVEGALRRRGIAATPENIRQFLPFYRQAATRAEAEFIEAGGLRRE